MIRRPSTWMRHGDVFRLLLFALVIAAAVVGGRQVGRADHVAGATYSGQHSGGGTVSFTVSVNGLEVRDFEISGVVAGDQACRVATFRLPFPLAISIANHTFRYNSGGADPFEFTGRFTSSGRAEGTFTIPPPPRPTCHRVMHTWTATTSQMTQSPTPTPTPTPSPTPASAPAGRSGEVRLEPGCGNVTLTFPDATMTSTVAAAISPAAALVSIWRHDAATNQMLGFAPQAPTVSDLRTVNRLAAVFICVNAPALLTQPTV